MDPNQQAQRISELEKSVKEQAQVITSKNAEIDTLNTAVSDREKTITSQASTIQDLNNTVATNEKTIASQASEIESLKEQVEKLLVTPDDQEQKSGVGQLFTVDGASYRILVANVSVPGFGKMTAEEVLASAEAQQELVKRKSAVIQAVI